MYDLKGKDNILQIVHDKLIIFELLVKKIGHGRFVQPNRIYIYITGQQYPLFIKFLKVEINLLSFTNKTIS